MFDTYAGQQDDPNDPSSASIKIDVTVEHAASLTAATFLDTDDFDLFLVYDANGDGAFTNGEIIAASTTGSSNEFISASTPPDGNYQVWVQGWSVAGTPDIDVLVDAIQGYDMTVSGLPDGAVPAGSDITLSIAYDKEMVEGESYFGRILLGPPTAPGAVSIPVTINRTS
jgi:hypothetical protein